MKAHTKIERDEEASSIPPVPSPSLIRETLLVFPAFCGLTLLQILLGGCTNLFTRHFWIDEIVTCQIASESSLLEALHEVRSGVDTNLPGLYLLLWPLTHLLGDTGEIALRSFTFITIVIALTGAYCLARHLVSPFRAFASAFFLWSHPELLWNAFNARQYALWVAAVTWFAFFIFRTADCCEKSAFGKHNSSVLSGRPLANYLGLVLCGLATCLAHYFGIVSVAIVVASSSLLASFNSRRGPVKFQVVVAFVPGFVAVLVCLFIFYVPQKASLTTSTWLVSPTLPKAIELVTTLLMPSSLAGVGILGAFGALLGACGLGGTRALTSRERLALVGLLSLAIMPFAMIGFSFTVQSVLSQRYCIPAALSLFPAALLIIRGMPRWCVGVTCLFLVLISTRELRHLSHDYRDEDRYTTSLIECIRTRASGEPIYFERPHDAYVLCRYAPDLVPYFRLIDWDNAESAGMERHWIFHRDQARMYAKFHADPSLEPWSEVTKREAFFLVSREPRAESLRNRFRGFVATQAGDSLYHMRRSKDASEGPRFRTVRDQVAFFHFGAIR